MSEHDTDVDMEVDVVVLGTGGSGLTAALAAHDFGAGEVLILEKFGMIGGTSAMSGGMLWIPLNDQQAERGVEDSFDEVVSYVDGLADDGHLDPEVFGAFLEEGPEMLRWFEEQTPVRLRLFEGFPDYQSWADGAKENGSRSLDNDVFPFEDVIGHADLLGIGFAARIRTGDGTFLMPELGATRIDPDGGEQFVVYSASVGFAF